MNSLLKSVITFTIYFLFHVGVLELTKFIFLRNSLMTLNSVYLSLVDPIVYLLYILICVFFIRRTFLENNERLPLRTNLILFSFGMALLYGIIKEPLVRIEVILGEMQIPHQIDQGARIDINSIITFVSFVVLAPLFEELLFRKIILSFFSRENIITGVIISSILFSIAHIDVTQIHVLRYVSLFIFGLIACLLYINFGFIYALVFHVFSNLIWFTLDLNRYEYWKLLEKLDFGLEYWVIIIISLLVVIYVLYRLITHVLFLDSPYWRTYDPEKGAKPSLRSILTK